MKAFLFTTEEIAEDAVAYGLKLSHHTAGSVLVYGKEHSYLEAYLHPADCPDSKRRGAVLKIQLEDHIYAMFLSAKALLVRDGYDINSHRSLIGIFGRDYVKNGEFDSNIAKYLSG